MINNVNTGMECEWVVVFFLLANSILYQIIFTMTVKLWFVHYLEFMLDCLPPPLSPSLYFALMKQKSFTLKFRGLFILFYYLNLVFLSDYKLFFRKFLTVLESLRRKMRWRRITLKKKVLGKTCFTNRVCGSLQVSFCHLFFLSFLLPWAMLLVWLCLSCLFVSCAH